MDNRVAGPAGEGAAARRPWFGAAALTASVVAAWSFASPALADLKVRMPTVEYRELELEHNGLLTFDKKGSPLNGQQSYTNEIEFGVLPFWQIGLEGELAAKRGVPLKWEATTIENLFQITEPGEYFFNFGLFAEYSQTTGQRNPNSFTFGPIIQKELNDVLGTRSLHTLNVFFSRDVGRGATRATALEYAWQSRLLLNGFADPAVEFYGTIDDIAHAGKFSDQTHFVGPALIGRIGLNRFGALKWEAGYLFGYTQATPRGAVRWRLEYELSF